MHEHSSCNHTLKYCEHCDVCYCTKCNKEWGKSTYYGYGGGTYGGPSITGPKLPPISPDINKIYCSTDDNKGSLGVSETTHHNHE